METGLTSTSNKQLLAQLVSTRLKSLSLEEVQDNIEANFYIIAQHYGLGQ